MEVNNNTELDIVSQLVAKSLRLLVEHDSAIFNMQMVDPPRVSSDQKKLNRKLHEITINHRLAYYLEILLHDTFLKGYFVDLEYNRFYEDPKKVKIGGFDEEARPDILIHRRTDNNTVDQHLLVIEAKKDAVSDRDLQKVRAFMSDDRYSYKYGFCVSYCRDSKKIIGTFFYKTKNKIADFLVEIEKQSPY